MNALASWRVSTLIALAAALLAAVNYAAGNLTAGIVLTLLAITMAANAVVRRRRG